MTGLRHTQPACDLQQKGDVAAGLQAGSRISYYQDTTKIKAAGPVPSSCHQSIQELCEEVLHCSGMVSYLWPASLTYLLVVLLLGARSLYSMHHHIPGIPALLHTALTEFV